MSTSKTCFVLILSIFSQRWSKHDQNSKVKIIKNRSKGLAYGLQDSRKSRLYHTLQSDKQASAKHSNCLPAIANIWFIQVNLSHQLLIQAKFWTEGKSSSRAESDGVGYSSISLPVRLHTAILLILLTQRNKSTAANPALQITACNATRKASSVFSFSPTWRFSPVPDDPSFPLYVLQWDSDPDFLACFTPCFFYFHGIWNPSLQTSQNTIPNLHALLGDARLTTLWWDSCIYPRHTTELVLFHPYQHPDLCSKIGTGHGNLRMQFGTVCYSKAKGRDTMSSLHPQFFPILRNTGASSFSNAVCPQLTEEGVSLCFLWWQGVKLMHMARFWWHWEMLQLWLLRTGVSSRGCRGYLLQHHGLHPVPPAPPLTLVFSPPFLFPTSSVCPVFSAFS